MFSRRCIVLSFFAATASCLIAQQEKLSSTSHVAPDSTYGRLPLSFEPNRGQVNSEVRFLAHAGSSTLFLTDSEAVLALSKGDGPARLSMARVHWKNRPTRVKTDYLRMQIVGAQGHSHIHGVDALPGAANYLVGSDAAKWQTNVPTFGKVRYDGVYPGVDLVYYGNGQRLEYDFVVAPHAATSPIQLHFAGATKVVIDKRGDLVLGMNGGEVAFHKPVIYQEEGGQRQAVAGSFQQLAKNTVGFRLGAYDHARELVIDPVLVYSSFLDQSGQITSVAVDGSGSAYITGIVQYGTLPTTPGSFQPKDPAKLKYVYVAFVGKLNPSGDTLEYLTYLGGKGDTLVGGTEATSIAVDEAGDAFIAGGTSQPDFPVTAGAFQKINHCAPEGSNAFVTKLKPDGSGLVYSTLLGGTGSTYSYALSCDSASAIAVDSSGDAYVAGTAQSHDFPVTSGAFQTTNNTPLRSDNAGYSNAFLTKLTSDGGALAYSTYFGGSTGSEYATSLAVDVSKHAYIAGYSSSTDFHSTKGSYHAPNDFPGDGHRSGFVAKFTSDGGGLVYSAHLGTDVFDGVLSLAVDSDDAAYLTGYTTSHDLPVTPGAFQQTYPTTDTSAFALPSLYVAKLDRTGTDLEYATYLGGAEGELSVGIAVDSGHHAILTGTTSSKNFPTTADAYERTAPFSDYAQPHFAFLTKFDREGNHLIYSTYLSDATLTGPSLDLLGAVYVGGDTDDASYPLTSGASRRTLESDQGDLYSYLAKFDFRSPASPYSTASAIYTSGSPSRTGATITITGVVMSPAGVPAGVLQLEDGGVVLQTKTLAPNAKTHFSVAGLAPGPHALTVHFEGNVDFAPSDSPVLTQVVEP